MIFSVHLLRSGASVHKHVKLCNCVPQITCYAQKQVDILYTNKLSCWTWDAITNTGGKHEQQKPSCADTTMDDGCNNSFT
jgi:hypothetical protein